MNRRIIRTLIVVWLILLSLTFPAFAGDKPKEDAEALAAKEAWMKNDWPTFSEFLLKQLKKQAGSTTSYASYRSTPESDLLIEAVENNDPTKVETLLLQNVGPNRRSSKTHISPLRTAIKNRNKPMIDLLIQYGADIQEHGLICDAVGNAEMIEWLMKKGAKIKNVRCWGGYLVYRKKATDRFDGAEILIKYGEDINSLDRGQAPLHDAVSQNNQNAVRWLLEHDADVKTLNQYGKSIICCSHSGDVEIVKMLFDHGAMLKLEEIQEYTSGACRKQNLSVLEFISRKGITPDYDACYEALARKSAPDKALLRWLNVRSKIRNIRVYDASLLHLAAGNNNVEIVRMLIKTGVDVNVKDKSDQTPLHYAVGKNNREIAGLLIKAGADVNAGDRSGRTPLFFAIPYGSSSSLYHKEMVALLLKNGADPNAKEGRDKDHKTALHELSEAVYSYSYRNDTKETHCLNQIQVDAAQVLIAHGADLHARTAWEGNTPLHIAAKSGHVPMMKLLVAHGADLQRLNKGMRTPLQCARYDDGRGLITMGVLLSLQEESGSKPDWEDLKEIADKSYAEPKRSIIVRFLDRLAQKSPGPARYKNLEAIVAELVYDTPEALMDRMKSCDPSVALAAAETATRNPDILKDPYKLYGISAVFFQHGKKDEAVFWFYAAQLRERYQWCDEKNNEHERMPFPSPEMFLGPALNSYAFRDTIKLRRIIDQVLAWDAKTPNPQRTEKRTETIDQKIIQLYAEYQNFKTWLIADQVELERKARQLAPEIEKTFSNPLYIRCQEDDKRKASEIKPATKQP